MTQTQQICWLMKDPVDIFSLNNILIEILRNNDIGKMACETIELLFV